MTTWKFYVSGILYGNIYEDETKEFPAGFELETLDVRTGCMRNRAAFTEEENLYFFKYCSRSIWGFFRKKREYEEHIRLGGAHFTTSEGDCYTRRKQGVYIQRKQKFPMDLLYEDGAIYGVCMSGRDSMAVLVKQGMEEKTVLSDWQEVYPDEKEGTGWRQPGPVYPVHAAGTFGVETRDGEVLATDVYLPGQGEGRYSTVLVRTPYGKSNGAEAYYRFVQRGYAVVIQDVRGREDSTGEWLPEYFEVEDGDDTLNWIASQNWSDGQVAMTGGSYLGYVQWAAAASGNPHLKAMLSSVCAGSAFIDIPRRGGCFNSGMLAWAFAMSERRMRPDLMMQENWEEILDIRPICSVPEKALGHPVAFLSKWLEHKDLDEFWRRSNWKERYQGKPVPALIMSGWFDDNGMGTTEALDLVKDWPQGTWKALLGPWKHSGNADYDLHGFYMGEEALRYDMDILCMKWLEHFLRGADNGIEATPTVEYYTLGENRWKTASCWPPEHTKEQVLYLDSWEGQKAAGDGRQCGRGILRAERPEESGEDAYDYDPENPSVHLVDMSENELEVPEDYTEMETRRDMLSFSTPALDRPVTVTGDMLVRLFVSCDCPDTDFMVRITDVDQQGRSMKLADGVISAKYRRGFDHAEYMEPGRVYEIEIRTTKISHCFLPGHQIRLTITSSAKNFIFPNSNTEEGFDSEEKRIAHVTVHSGGACASCVRFWVEGDVT